MLTKKRWISLCLAAVMLLCCIPVIPAQAETEQELQVDYPVCVSYGIYNQFQKFDAPVVKSGDVILRNNVDYTYSYSFANRQMQLGQSETLTVTGIGSYAGFSRTYPIAVVKEDIANCSVQTTFGPFQGEPLDPWISVHQSGKILTENVHYKYFSKDNVNVGTATARFVGVGDCFYGYKDAQNSIWLGDNTYIELQGAYIGQADGTLKEETYYAECYIPAGYAIFDVPSSSDIAAYYQLYRIEGEEMVEVATKLVEPDSNVRTSFGYDFDSVYEDAADEGGAVYILVYAWADERLAVYSGTLAIGVIAKVGPATEITMERIENDGDFRSEYFNVAGTDGVVDSVVWESSNTKVATVEDGIVTMKTPGTATITAKFGTLEATAKVTAAAMDICKASLFHYNEQTGEAAVIYENRLLTENVDYTLSVEKANGITNVAVSGCGLFEGQLLQQYDANGETVGHAHTYQYGCATKCDSCDFTRTADAHTPGDKLGRDAEGHWHVCKLCGEKQDYEAHTFTDPDTCGVCGGLNLPGDMNNDYEVTDADAVYLLRHTLFEDSYPITRNGDFNKDGAVTDADAIYLLRYTLFGDSYPIE